MTSSSDAATVPRARLIVQAPRLTALTVVSSGLREVAQATSTIDASLPPGIYRVRAVMGEVTRDEYRVLRPGKDETVQFRIQELEHRSIAPLRHTHDLHCDHAEVAARISAQGPHVQLGHGCTLFVMARGHHSSGRDPAIGLSLVDATCKPLLDLTKVGERSIDEDSPWAACKVEVDPGTYLLRVEVDARIAGDQGMVLMQAVVASPGWQTQVFLPQGAYGGAGQARHADLVGAVVFMCRHGFQPDSVDARSDDLARLMLAGRVPVSEASLEQLFSGEYQNPMLGIYGGHLLLRECVGGGKRLADVVRHLRSALGTPHPDVEALALALDQEPTCDFAAPPMLQSSWSVVVDHTVFAPALVPERSVAMHMATRRWGRGPWLIWNDAAPGRDAPETPRPFEEVLGDLGRLHGPDGGHPFAQPPKTLSATELAAFHVLRLNAESPEDGPSLPIKLVHALGLPMTLVTRSVDDLASKLASPAAEAVRPTFPSCVEWVPYVALDAGKDRAALARAYQWRPGDILTVGFLDGDPVLRARVQSVAKLWENYANLTLVFIDDAASARIRITFDRPGASSVLGTACDHVPPGQPTMVLGAVDASTPPTDVHRLVLHEFGHALGLIHEHQNPAGGIRWNEPVALAYYRRQTGWNDETIARNIFDAYAQDVAQFAFTAVDRASIMMYPIPGDLTLDGFEVGWNANLSGTDIEFIRQMYPGRPAAPPPAIPEAFATADARTNGVSPPDTTPVRVARSSPETPAMPVIPPSVGPVSSGARSSGPRSSGGPRSARSASKAQRDAAFVARLLARRPQDRPIIEARLRGPVTEGPGLHGMPSAPPAGVLETIVHDERPVLFVRDILFDTSNVTLKGNEAKDLVRLLEQASARVMPLLPLVGRIDVENLPGGPWVGTGWFVDSDIVVTNRHVASLIAQWDGRRFVFSQGAGATIEATLAMGHLVDDESITGETFPITEVLYIEPESGPNDIAFIRVARRTNGATPAFIPLAGSDAGADLAVCVVGYPARAPKRIIPDQALMRSLYRDVFDVKRIAPGYSVVTRDGVTEHDCTTLGGNSGSVVLDLATGNAVGLHFAGVYRDANFAVPATTLREYVTRKRWTRPPDIEIGPAAGRTAVSPPQPPPPRRPSSAPTSTPASTTAATLSFNLPITVTLQIGVPIVGVQAAAVAGVATPMETIEQALLGYWDSRPAGVVAARIGYLDEGSQIGAAQCIAVSVKPERLPAFEPMETTFRGHPVRYFPATAIEQVESRSTIEAAIDSVAYDDEARTGESFSFDAVKEEMDVLLHVGPEYSWDTLRAFLEGTTGKLISAMYEFHAPHIKDTIEARLAAGAALKLVVDDTTFAKVRDEDEEFDRVEVFADWTDRFASRFERVVVPEGTKGLIANAYHIKVSVREDDTFWLSSGNWKLGSSQPIVTDEMRAEATEVDLPGNREWHVVIKSPTLARRFRSHIDQDFTRSTALGGGPISKARAREEELVIPIEESLVPERRAPSALLEPLRIARAVKVRPLLTPDQEGAVYSEAVLDLIRGAKKSLLFQIPYIGMSPNPRTDRGYIDALIEALVERLLSLDDARVILRSGGAKLSSPTHTAWYFKSKGVDIDRCLRVIDNHHTKGMIVDGKKALLGSHNWSGPGVTLNRDASLLFDDKEVAAYYAKAFEIDWARANKARPIRFKKEGRAVREGAFGTESFRRVTLDELLGDD